MGVKIMIQHRMMVAMLLDQCLHQRSVFFRVEFYGFKHYNYKLIIWDICPCILQGKKKESKKKLVMGRGPTTRSRANVGSKTTEDGSDKEPTHHSVQPTTVANPLIEIPQADDGNGSMTAFLALRKRQQEEAKKEKEEKEKLEKERVEKKKALADASKKVVQESMPEIEEGDEEGKQFLFYFISRYKFFKFEYISLLNDRRYKKHIAYS